MRRYVQAACVLSVIAFATLAHADDAAMAEAQARFKEGLELADTAKFEEARLKFLQAFAVLKAPAVLFNLASTEQKTGHDVEAIEHYRAFLKSGANDTRITDAMRDRARQNIAELLKKVGQVDIEAPEGSKVSVDGKPLDDFPKEPVPVAPGKHKIEAAFSGKIRSVNVDCQQGQVAKAKIDFENGGSDTTYNPPAGSDGQRTTAGWVVPISLGVLGVGGLVMGGVFSSATQSSKDDSEAMRQNSPGLCAPPAGQACTDYDSKRSDAESQATLGYVGYIAGGALLVGAVATFIFWPKSGKSSSPSRGMIFTPQVGPQVAGGNLQLHF
ncbi:MAG: hypothetical protein K0S65_1373 [Labilithrix sp.]|nr:hypothetical protein [Labilithrix sp.]